MASISIPSSLPREVLNEVCFAALRPHRDATGLQTLTSLARTSRLFHEPAVNAIWRHVPNVLTLIRTLPEDLWLQTRITNDIRNDLVARYFRTRLGKSFKRPPVKSDFARLKHYAHRIERILYANTCLIPPAVLNALAAHFPAGTFLPNIRSFAYQYLIPPPSELNHSLEILFGLKLERIYVIGAASGPIGTKLSPNAESFDCIRALARICPKLSRLSIRLEPKPKRPLITVVPEMITAFQDLTYVFVSHILLDLPAILHLASLQNLEVLNAYLSDNIPQSNGLSLTSISPSRQAGYFPSLKNMSLEHRSLSLFTLLLKLVSSPDLDEVMLSIPETSDATCTSEDVSELLVELSLHTALTRITVSVDSSSPVTGPRFDSTTFTPLLALPGLCILDIDIAHPVDIDDELIASMAATWSDLTQLSLGVARPHSHTDISAFLATRTPTLFGLVPFALFCPHLEWLGLPLDTNLWSDPYAQNRLERRPGCGARLSQMTALDVGLSVVYDPVAVAAFLSDLFPELNGAWTAWQEVKDEEMSADLLILGRPRDLAAKWSQVADLVIQFAAVREQEEIYRQAHGQWNGEPEPELVEDAS
ncbi:hypothetical protein GSI_02379 [Ganoderma sinense ZZ0214-1]|uniref:F-box domain-containing protein n=1 Tax=Ganoderma sinense ZZ0214-1 TaxID=1077348 RepID=A0A2G8SPF4_9APHY|nr:hypothetical protein GSI_02379 [Ganoderma sinense ZZ0214-1]